MQTAQMILEPCEAPAPPAFSPLFITAARPSRELLAMLTRETDAARIAGRIDDACVLLDFALALNRVQK
jgi:hypothetical protein